MSLRESIFTGLYGIVGTAPDGAALDAAQVMVQAEALLAGGARVVQLRHKTADGRVLVEFARALRGRCHAAGALCIVNDRLDVALAAGVDGVHLGQEDLPVEAARRVVQAAGRERFVLGLSTHDAAQVREAVSLGVDYLGFGPVFGTATKTDALSSRGLEALEEAVRLAAPLPVVAIGGISLDRAAAVHATGAAMAAVIGDIFVAPDPAERARRIDALWR